MKHIFIVNGYPSSGKDEFVVMANKILNRNGIVSFSYSSVYEVKKAARILGWNDLKTEKDRKVLSDLKVLASKYWDGPFKHMVNQIENYVEDEQAIFLFIREPEEIERMVDTYPHAIPIFIDRDDHEKADNMADNNVEDYDYHYYIDNNRTKEDLEKTVETFLENVGLIIPRVL